MPDQFSCLGLSFFGLCSYDPAKPGLIYFSLGEAIAALALTLALQQFLAPLYLFRLRAYGLRIFYLIISIFLGFLCVLVAAILPDLPISHKGPLEYPIVWELIGALLIALPYFVGAIVLFMRVRIYSLNLYLYVRAASRLLTEADDTTRLRYAEDLLGYPQNIVRLVSYASALDQAEAHEDQIEMERKRDRGLPMVVQGRAPPSAFYRFAHREELARGSDAAIFLRILSDPQFCSVLVRLCPWLTASFMRFVSENRIHGRRMVLFVQEIATQSIVNDESIISKEMGLEGFGAVPLLSNNVFGNGFILHNYDPFYKGRIGGLHGDITPGFVSRFGHAANLSVQAALDAGEMWRVEYVSSVHYAYQALFRDLSYGGYRKLPVGILVDLEMGVRSLYKDVEKTLNEINIESLGAFYARENTRPWENIIATLAETLYDSLEYMANGFEGYSDPGWTHVSSVFWDLFAPSENVAIGLNPFQQNVAVQLLKKLRDNMNGYYPAISRILLSALGPYESKPNVARYSPAGIIRDAVYRELQKLRPLYERDPDKIPHFLPPHVSYDPTADSLTFTYTSGDTATTKLGTLNIDDIDLTNPKYRQWTFYGNVMGLAL